MGSLRSTFTALLLCISLVSMEDFLILAHRDLNKSNNETRYQGQASAKRSHRVSRMAAEEAKEEVRSSMKLTTGANPSSVRKCGHGEKEEPRVGCELSLRIRPSSSRSKFVELIPFGTDYHPPKNNHSHLLISRGDAEAALTEFLQPSNTEESSAKATKPDWKKKEDEANEVQGTGKAIEASYSNTRKKITAELKLYEASDEIFKMLNRDYNLRPCHHPPVHN